MASRAPLLAQLENLQQELPRTQRALARYVLANYQTVAFATVKELAKLAGVSEATVIRFVQSLSFQGYPGFQKEIRRLVRVDLKGPERFRLSRATDEAGRGTLDLVIRKELENLSQLTELFDREDFLRAIEAIRGAPEIAVIGSRSAAPLAHHLWFGATKIGLRATRVLAITTEAFDLLNCIDARACVVVIEFPRHLAATIRLLGLLRRRGITTVCISDSRFSPLRGDINLHVPVESASFVGFYCAPLCLINALLHELGVTDSARTFDALNAFEALADSEGYFVED